MKRQGIAGILKEVTIMKKVISLVLALALFAMSAVAFAATPVAATELEYKGDLVLMHFSTSEESEGNGGSDGFRTTIAAWKEAHPDINLIENVLATAEYKTQVATLAAADNLPDVFLLRLPDHNTFFHLRNTAAFCLFCIARYCRTGNTAHCRRSRRY